MLTKRLQWGNSNLDWNVSADYLKIVVGRAMMSHEETNRFVLPLALDVAASGASFLF